MPPSEPSDLTRSREGDGSEGFPIAGVGASAGGVGALQALFAALPERTGVAFVVIIHLSPEHKSELASILANACAMPVDEVHGEMALEPDHVYVIPPGRALEISDSHLNAVPFEKPRGHRTPIDTFFLSLAERHGDGFAVVLSGGDADGAIGARAIKERGGLVLVQEPAEAAFDTMPRATIATGVADLVLPVRELAVRLGELAVTKRRVRESLGRMAEQPLDEKDDDVLKGLLAHLQMRTGHDFSGYKRATMLRRIARRMQVNDRETLEAYAGYVRQNAEEAQALFDDLLITVTTFFRDPDAWQALAEQVIPALFEGRPDGEPLRAWVPGCATGEEAYTLAMLLVEEAERRERWPEVQVFASDLDEGSLATARTGCYPASIAADVEETRLSRFFVREDGHFRVNKTLRERVLFAAHSLLGDPPFTRLDLISCRNLLIYLERDAQRRAFDLFRYALVPGGFLLLGSAESAGADHFDSLDKRHRLFRARAKDPSPSLPALPLHGRLMSPVPAVPAVPAVPRADDKEGTAAYADVMALVPPSVLVDERFESVRLLGGAGRYMEPADGASSRSLVDLVRPELRTALQSQLYRAFEHGEKSLGEPVRVSLDGRVRDVVLSVVPRREAERPTRALVVFVEGHESADDDAGSGTAPGDGRDGHRERQAQEALQLSEGRRREANRRHESSAEALRASNEELQSVNEEYRSTTEELETSKEELQSINEELNTVNAELRAKFEEVSHARDDLENLMVATDIATLFLDRELAIQRFTPSLSHLINVTLTDLGRSIASFTHRLDYDTLIPDAREVLRSLAPLEREARHEDGRVFAVRLGPYRTAEDRIDGVVVTFVDITARLGAERALAASEARLRALLESLPAVVPFATDAEGRVSYIGPSIRDYAGVEPATLLGTTICTELVHPDDRAHSEAAWIESRERGAPYEMRHRLRAADGKHRWAITRARPVKRDGNAELEWFGAITDVDELTGVETTLREVDRHRNRFIGLLGHELRNPLAAIGNALQVLAELDEETRAAVHAAGVPIGRTVAVLERQSRHMTRLVNDLLDLTRIGNGKIELQTRSIALADHVEQTLEVIRPRLADAGLAFDVHLPDPALHLVADPDRLGQMLDNLLDNAIKYSDPGGQVELVVARERDEALITVRDSGIGIAPEALPVLFQPFTQILDSSGPGRGGLGLGLALIRSLVELHGGTLEASSDGLGKGSEFRLRLPLHERANARASSLDPPRSQAQAPLSARRILLVDDSPDVADPFAALLRVIGQEVHVTYDGDDALAAVADFDPQVAFLDLGMPGMDGFELARRLRRLFPAGTLVMIALSGYAQAEDIARARAAGFEHHLLKPVLLDSVRELLRTLE